MAFQICDVPLRSETHPHFVQVALDASHLGNDIPKKWTVDFGRECILFFERAPGRDYESRNLITWAFTLKDFTYRFMTDVISEKDVKGHAHQTISLIFLNVKNDPGPDESVMSLIEESLKFYYLDRWSAPTHIDILSPDQGRPAQAQ